LKLPRAPQRTTPGFAFSILDRALTECLGARQFGQEEMAKVLTFFEMGQPECVFCGSPEVARWDHLVAVTRDGETVLGNMVPACARCDDSKRSLPFDEWMAHEAEGSPRSHGIDDIAGRIERIKAYVQHFGYQVRPLHERLTEEELETLLRIRSRFSELRAETDFLIAGYRTRTGHR
jgi:hypothetical protein